MKTAIRSGSAEFELVRSICRAVIRRVKEEHPTLRGSELLMCLHAAAPFVSAGPELEEVWLDEVARTLALPVGPGPHTIQ